MSKYSKWHKAQEIQEDSFKLSGDVVDEEEEEILDDLLDRLHKAIESDKRHQPVNPSRG